MSKQPETPKKSFKEMLAETNQFLDNADAMSDSIYGHLGMDEIASGLVNKIPTLDAEQVFSAAGAEIEKAARGMHNNALAAVTGLFSPKPKPTGKGRG